MKTTFKTVTFAAVLMFLAAACTAGKSLASRVREYNSKTEAIIAAYKQSVDELQSQNLVPEAFTGKAEELYNDVVQQLVDLGRKTLENKPYDSLSIIALRDISGFIEPDEVLGYIEKMDSSIRETEEIAALEKIMRAKASVVEGARFIDFAVVPDPEKGDTVRLSDFVGKGKYILADFWASWCGPCKREIPNIKAVYEKYAGENFDVLSIAVWDKPEDTAKAAEEHGVVWSQIVNTDRVATDAYGIEGIPHIILFGPDGTIISRGLRGSDIETAVKAALGK